MSSRPPASARTLFLAEAVWARIASLLCCLWLSNVTGGAETSLSREDLLARHQATEAAFSAQLQKLAARCREIDERVLAPSIQITSEWQFERLPRRQYFFLTRSTDSSQPANDAPLVVRQWHSKFLELRRNHSAELVTLARHASDSGQASLAYCWLCQALREDPRSAEALRALDLSEPSASGRGRAPTAASPRVDHPRTGWRRGTYWRTETEHFLVSTNHSGAIAVEVAQRLEELHDVWRQLYFPFWSTPEALAARLAGRNERLGPRRQHQIVVFRSRDEYITKLKPSQPRIELTSGYYVDEQRTVFLYAGDDTTLPSWYHEVTHQLLQETLNVEAGLGARGNMWFVEGIATYMESLRRFDGGYVTVGGFESQRLQYARYARLRGAAHAPLDELVQLTRDSLQQHPEIRSLYTQSAGLSHMLMDADDGRWREGAMAYLAAIYARRDTPETLSRQLQTPLDAIDQEYPRFLQVNDQDLLGASLPGELRQLSLGRTTVTDAGLATIRDLPKLEWLDLAFLKVTDKSVAQFRNCKSLRQLFLEETQITDESLTIVANFANLEELDLAGTAITDEGLARLASLKKLRALYLTRCPITDKGLKHITGLKHLETLDLSETKVSSEARQQLRRSLPKWQSE